jgi:hypothetical protein
MALRMRPYREGDDYWRIRELLRRAMVANGRRERSWHVARLDYWWWFANPDLEHLAPEDHVFLWETAGGELAAALCPEGPGQAFLQVDPSLREPGLEEAMVAVAEERLAVVDEDGRWPGAARTVLRVRPRVPRRRRRGRPREPRRPRLVPPHPGGADVPAGPGHRGGGSRRVRGGVLHGLVRRRVADRVPGTRGHRRGPSAAWPGAGGDPRGAAPAAADGLPGGVRRWLTRSP